ncbi:PTS sugar transporter subunit IIA [Corynebacterium uberis]|uniref:PTS sugar transporter subunit IIA n=1 Tax=Corynebacterium uberis TaxID=2883169 RepID=UPI001D0BCA32|nr:PTS glucose transporter subunit IIA [Corynebacterium uberis]UDL72664.1 PTS glucose transporter subunit IIA [Corynebacterium uberis]UDL83090.1 PTS glucose transporter subunit IIA [Corynebacterium uberis]
MIIHAPLSGTVTPLAQVPDPVFSAGMVGGGMAVTPPDDAETLHVVAPVSGRLVQVMPHAFAILTPEGPGILVHVGLDTVELEGRGFATHKAKGDQVAAGEEVITVTAGVVREAELSLVCPVVVMDAAGTAIARRADADAAIDSGELLFELS